MAGPEWPGVPGFPHTGLEFDPGLDRGHHSNLAGFPAGIPHTDMSAADIWPVHIRPAQAFGVDAAVADAGIADVGKPAEVVFVAASVGAFAEVVSA